jgi:hypothetical protein
MDEQHLEMILSRLDSIDRHLEKLNTRTGSLETWRGYLTGSFAVLIGGIAWFFRIK